MNILMTGGTGFIGKALCAKLLARGDDITILSRHPQPAQQGVEFIPNLADFTDLNHFDAVINLAGEPIFQRRWSAKQKATLWQSRVQLTTQLSQLILQSDTPPHTFLSGSATGIYGNLPLNQKASESTPCGTAFPAQLCLAWEQAAELARHKTRLCLLRTGIVLDEKGGALQQMLPLYRLGLGGKLASGQQHWSWIALEDHLNGMLFLLDNPHCEGIFNFVAPHSVSNATFNQLLAKKLHRPAFCAVPQFALNLIFGERAQLLLDNQPLVPQALLDAGFQFRYSHLADYFEID
ncbi:epimerase [Pasteurellaceae bacterium Macca]|nr:epimerase [Pasteurellaceae bacterium Macca]